jgi:hypothetical protein
VQTTVEVLLGACVGVAVGAVITGIRLWLTLRHHHLLPTEKERT